MMEGRRSRNDHIQLITFGSPRVLQKKDADRLADFIDHLYRAVKNGLDPVSNYPLPEFGHFLTNPKSLGTY